MRTSALIACLCVLPCVACGGEDDTGGDAADAAVAPVPDAAMRVSTLDPPAAPGVQVTSGEIPVGAGEEFTTCAYFDLPSDEPLLITRLEHAHRGFMHHYVLHRAGADDYEDGSVGECPSGGILIHAANPPVFPGTKDQKPFQMPDGVGYRVEARQPMFMQVHLLNATDDAAVEELVINLHGVDEGADLQLAGIIAGGDINFEIPPGGEYTETQDCNVSSPGNVFALTSHAHARMRAVDVSLRQGGELTPVYHNTDWAEPAVEYLDPPAPLEAGDGMRFSCTWLNEDDRTIRYGDLASDEMCIVFGYYYPATGDSNPCLGL